MANTGGKSGILSVEGIMMLFIAGMLDIAGIVCAILVIAFGVGAVLGRIVSGFGFGIIGVWQLFRSGTVPSRGSQGGMMGQIAKKTAKKFLKKHWWKLGLEAIPVVGDVAPSFLLMVYSELK